MAKQTLDSWIHEAMTDGDKEAPISAFTLVHVVGQTAEREIHTVRLGSKQWTAADLAALLRHKAQSYCQDVTGVQTFCLLAFYGKEEPEARHPFLITGELDLNGSTEAPDEKGIKQQSMRHLEANAQMYHRGTAHVMDVLIRSQEILARENAALRQENREGFTMMKELIAQQALNRHEHRMKELEFERSSQERKKWLSFVPSLVNTVLGSEVFPQNTEDTALIESIANSLSEEDLIKLSGILKPEVLGPISARLEKHYKEKQLQGTTASKLLKGRSGEEDAAGD